MKFVNLPDLNGNRITNVGDPAAAQDVATKAYVDATAQGLDIKASVRAASTINLVLNGTQTVDGVVLIAGDRILVKDQAAASQNGIYAVAAGAWARTADANTAAKLTAGLFTFVEEGAVNADSGWVLTTNQPIVVDTTNLVFVQFSGAGQITAGAGLTKTGNTIDVIGGTGITVGADLVSVDTAVVARKVTAVLAGVALAYVVTHNLNNQWVTVQVFATAAPFGQVFADVELTDANNITIRFAVAPATGDYRVVITG